MNPAEVVPQEVECDRSLISSDADRNTVDLKAAVENAGPEVEGLVDGGESVGC